MDAQPHVVALTERQTRVLWLLSMGRSRDHIAKDTGDTRGGVNAACHRIFCLLEAATAAQAVRVGLLDGHIGPYEDCGTLAAYRRHIKRDEVICPACKRGNRERLETEAALRNNRVQMSQAEIRLLRAFDAGRTREQIALAWNVSGETVKHLATSAYRSLGVSHLPQSVRREAALREARRRGLLASTPPPQTPPPVSASLTNTHVNILLSMESGTTLAQTAERLGLRPGTCSTRLSEAYRRLDVAWMEKGARLPAALRKARALGLVPEPATT